MSEHAILAVRAVRSITKVPTAGHRSVEGQRYPLDPPPPHAVTGGGRSNLAFWFSLSLSSVYT